MKLRKRALALCAAAALLAAMPLRAQAAEAAGKEEVVYINLLPDGTPDTVDVVNIFDLPQGGAIRDWGDYASVRNMTTTDPLTLEDGQVTGDVGPGKLYYEGRLENAAIPWDISIGYELDGTEVAPEELGGRSGQLTMHITAAKNPACAGTYFEDYALQISLTLDGDRAADIQAPGATMANVGGDKQLTYTVLPGKGADITLTAQVTDFAMEPIAINGVALSLEVDVDDEELLSQVTDLTDAIAQLDEGAGTISDGTAELTAGIGQAAQGASALYFGASSLWSGASELKSGGDSVQSGAASVSAGAAEVDVGAQGLKSGLDSLSAGLSALNDQSAALTGGSAQVLAGLQSIQAGLSGGGSVDTGAINATLAGLESQADSLTATLSGMSGLSGSMTEIAALLRGVSGNLQGIINSHSEDAELKGQLEAVQGSLGTVINQYATILLQLAPLQSLDVASLQAQLASAKDCLGQLSGMTASLDALKTGVDTLTAQYVILDEAIQAYTAGVADACSGCGQLVSGASDLTAGTASLAEGAGSLASGAATLAEGISDVYDAAGTLTAGAGSLDSGVGALAEGAATLGEGAGQMKEGTAALAEGTNGMDQQVADGIDGMLADITGSGERPMSFASEKNGQVDAVQFVIRTPAIEVPAPAQEEPAPEEEPSFWEKLIALF